MELQEVQNVEWTRSLHHLCFQGHGRMMKKPSHFPTTTEPFQPAFTIMMSRTPRPWAKMSSCFPQLIPVKYFGPSHLSLSNLLLFPRLAKTPVVSVWGPLTLQLPRAQVLSQGRPSLTADLSLRDHDPWSLTTGCEFCSPLFSSVCCIYKCKKATYKKTAANKNWGLPYMEDLLRSRFYAKHFSSHNCIRQGICLLKIII